MIFANDNYYHIYNRGVDKRRIFMNRVHYSRFLETINNLLTYGQAKATINGSQSLAFNKKLSFICYCLLPNHHHFLIKQLEDNAISKFMHKLNTSYTKYFNLNHHRTGRLYEYTFKAVHVVNDEQLLHLSRYIHLNPLLSHLTSDLKTYPWSSYPDYLGIRDGKLCNKEEVLSLFGNIDQGKKYEKFVLDQIEYAKRLKDIEKILLDYKLQSSRLNQS